MFQVGQKIFAKQNWTIISASRDLSPYHPFFLETHELQGARGSCAIMMRTVSSEDGKASQWKLIRNTQSLKDFLAFYRCWQYENSFFDDSRERSDQMKVYKVQSARDAQEIGYGDESYWDYLEESALEKHTLFKKRGDNDTANLMLTRSLSESLAGNDGA